MTNCKRCEELLSVLREVKALMDSEHYSLGFDTIYDKIATAIGED